ncbi:hypothetical protein BH11PLA1_BH11PLA1_08150 [soil metagenome]
MNPGSPASRSTLCPLDILAAACRLALGALFLYSGWLKLGLSDFGGRLATTGPDQFLFAIHKFEIAPINDAPRLAAFLAFAIPWTELVIAAALLLGLWSRAAALLAFLLMLAFIGGLAGVLLRDLDVECGCFGSIAFLCPAKISACHIFRNVVFAALAAVVLLRGSGPLAFDRLLTCRARAAPASARPASPS